MVCAFYYCSFSCIYCNNTNDFFKWIITFMSRPKALQLCVDLESKAYLLFVATSNYIPFFQSPMGAPLGIFTLGLILSLELPTSLPLFAFYLTLLVLFFSYINPPFSTSQSSSKAWETRFNPYSRKSKFRLMYIATTFIFLKPTSTSSSCPLFWFEVSSLL